MGRLTNAMGEISESKFKLAETVEIMRRTVEALHGVSELPMTHVTVPSAGGRYFMFSDDEAGDMPPVNAFEGVILSANFVNAYWEHGFGEGGEKTPNCMSTDGISGWDRDGLEHVCKTCPRNRMGSRDGGRGKACRNNVQLMVLLEGEPLPVVLKVPTMSVPNYVRYVAGVLTPRGLQPYQVTTRFGLMKATNANGVDYSQIMLNGTGRVNDDEIKALMGEVTPLLETSEAAEAQA